VHWLGRTLQTGEADARLREAAVKLGANAVIKVHYQRAVSGLVNYKSVTASGWAVIAQPVTKLCPYCAETIKTAAKVCRFCGHDFGQGSAA
jgi:hypothetical protein